MRKLPQKYIDKLNKYRKYKKLNESLKVQIMFFKKSQILFKKAEKTKNEEIIKKTIRFYEEQLGGYKMKKAKIDKYINKFLAEEKLKEKYKKTFVSLFDLVKSKIMIRRNYAINQLQNPIINQNQNEIILSR
jgi:L,D-peptidoglycan transpeptidase YkuD (ErfK/YbiS/YcfS/YnhG family)